MRIDLLKLRIKAVALTVFAVVAAPASGQTLEPGEWEFNAVTSSPLFPTGQSMVFKRCVTAEDAANPERWMARHNEKADCKLTPGERTSNSMRWEMACPKSNLRGNGIARITGPGTVESDMQMTGELQGQRFSMNTRTTGRRLGPCKT
jgi:hypothetical protein